MTSSLIKRANGHIFIRIPSEFAKPVETGCCCNYCKANPDKTPLWDTIVVAAEAESTRPEYTNIVHYPDFGSRFKD